MFFSTFCQAQSQLKRMICAVLLCLGYFNYSLIAELIKIFFRISSLTGKVIVNKFLSICDCILELTRITYLFFEVLYEDLLIFLKDARDKFAFFIFLLQKFYLFLENFGWRTIEEFLQLGEALWNISAFVYYTFVSVKEGIKFLGLNIWHLFTGLPEIVILKINGFNEFLWNTSVEFKNSAFKLQEKIFDSLKETYLVLFHIPLDSIYGLIIGAVLLIILCSQFKKICIFMISFFLKLYEHFTSFGICLWSGRFLEQKSKRSTDYIFEDNEILCIICQYKLKEMIIFPCKHLCVCGDCSLQLTKNQPLCPICRSEITGTLKVYL